MSNRTLDQALDHAQGQLDRELEELEARRVRVREQEQVVAALQTEVSGIQMAMARLDDAPEQPNWWQGLLVAVMKIANETEQSRTAVVVRILEEAGRPLTPTQIVKALNQLGRYDNIHAVSATLSHLARSGRVEKVSRGQWQVPDVGLPKDTT